jgi:hypothetical protein
MDGENLSEFYYEQLKDTTNPALVLCRFYDELFSKHHGKSEIIMFNRLLKLYGRFTVYFALLDVATMSEVNFDNGIFGLLSYMAKKRIEVKYGVNINEAKDLNREATSIEKLISKQKKVKLEAGKLDE